MPYYKPRIISTYSDPFWRKNIFFYLSSKEVHSPLNTDPSGGKNWTYCFLSWPGKNCFWGLSSVLLVLVSCPGIGRSSPQCSLCPRRRENLRDYVKQRENRKKDEGEETVERGGGERRGKEERNVETWVGIALEESRVDELGDWHWHIDTINTKERIGNLWEPTVCTENSSQALWWLKWEGNNNNKKRGDVFIDIADSLYTRSYIHCKATICQ